MQRMVTDLSLGVVTGLLAFPHCLCMCGSFTLHLAQEGSRGKLLLRQVQWLVGKGCGYVFLGALAGYAGGYLERALSGLVLLQKGVAWVVGVGMVLMGWSLLGLIPAPIGRGGAEEMLAPLVRSLLMCRSSGATLLLGSACAFLPCPVVLAVLLLILQHGSVLHGMVAMAALATGSSLPLLLFGGACGDILRRRWTPKVGALLLILLGITTAVRGAGVHHTLPGCPAPHSESRQEVPKGPCIEVHHGVGHP